MPRSPNGTVSSSDSDQEDQRDNSGRFFCVVLIFILFIMLVPSGLYLLERHRVLLTGVKRAMQDGSHVFPISGARDIDLNTASKVIGKLVLIPDVPEFDAVLTIPQLNLQLPGVLAAKIVEEEIEEDAPGGEIERETMWVEKTDVFHGYSAMMQSGSVYLGPLALSDKLMSQYVTSKKYLVQKFGDVAMLNITDSNIYQKHKFQPDSDQKYFYRTETTPMDCRFSIHVVPMKENITILALAGSDNFLYPATLLGIPLDEFYEGTRTLVDIILHFEKETIGPILFPLYLFRFLLFVWTFCLLLLINVFHYFEFKRKHHGFGLTFSVIVEHIVFSIALGSMILGSVWYSLESSDEAEYLFFSGSLLIILLWLLGGFGTKKKKLEKKSN